MLANKLRTKALQDILMNRDISIFDLPLRERLVLVRHLLQKRSE